MTPAVSKLKRAYDSAKKRDKWETKGGCLDDLSNLLVGMPHATCPHHRDSIPAPKCRLVHPGSRRAGHEPTKDRGAQNPWISLDFPGLSSTSSLAAWSRLSAQIVSGLLPSHCTVSGDPILGLKPCQRRAGLAGQLSPEVGARSTPLGRWSRHAWRQQHAGSPRPALSVASSLARALGLTRHGPSVPRIRKRMVHVFSSSCLSYRVT